MTLSEAIGALRAAGIDSPEHDARELFRHFEGIPRYAPISGEAVSHSEELSEALRRRAERVPLQYIIGEVGFYRESYRVSPAVLIPRQDTEILVDFAVRKIPRGESFIDLCTGSGCVAVSTLKNTKDTSCLAIDISEAALGVALENAELNSVGERVEFRASDALSFVPADTVFAILSNPPYVTEEEYALLEPELYFEPRLALVGADSGLEFYKKIAANCRGKIKENGFIAFEIGSSQGEALREIAAELSMSAEIIKDLSGLDRVAVLRRTAR